ncbi:hypothetical protein [Microbacterium pumilum]|uniref:Tryptophan-rich sensory protein n=1 Tax=Microbacterium pumilum TaxID=344165 RepID=A0ABP5DCU8_9MICO
MSDRRGTEHRAAGWLLRLAGVSAIIGGLGFGWFTIPAMASVAEGHGPIWVMGFPAYGYGPLSAAGFATTVPLLAVFLVACLVQAAGGVLLLWRLTAGVVVTIIGIALSAVFWWGFVLPLGWAGAVVQLALMAFGWSGRRSNDLVSPSDSVSE